MVVTRLFFSILFVATAVASVAVLALGLSIADFYGQNLPSHLALRTYTPKSGTEVLAADGSVLAKHADERRTFVPYAEIPYAVVQAFVSAEDKNYWTHSGVDPLAIIRAGLTNFASGRMVGASTITQQVAKNQLVGDEKSLPRKIREALLAMRMDGDLGKERILEIYLNDIYLGMGAYGVVAAADAFFSKTLDQLTIGEIALLAAMPKAPSAFDPRRNPERATERRDYVLRRMVEDGALRAEDAERAIALPIALNPNPNRQPESKVTGGWFEQSAWDSVKDYVNQDDLSHTDVVVHTTLEPEVQAAAVASMRKGIIEEDHRLGWRGPLDRVALPVNWADTRLAPPAGSDMFTLAVVEGVGETIIASTQAGASIVLDKTSIEWTGKSLNSILEPGDVILVDFASGAPVLAQMPAVEGAMVVLDPRNGDVLSLVGGFSHDLSVFDRATQARRQPGSAFKPIVYLTALELGYDATSSLLDASITLEQGPGQEDWRPSDAKGAGAGGLITLRRALELSRNMASVRLLWDVGLTDVANMSNRLGIDPGASMTYAIGLGAGEVSPMQLALAYATMANGGHALRPRYVTNIETKDGLEVGVVPGEMGQQIVDPVAAAQMVSILRGVVERGTAKSAFEGFDRPFAGKTGTTNSSRDAWFAGLASDVVVVTWIGRDDNQPLADGASGGRTAAAIVRNFLDLTGTRFQLGDPALPEGLTAVTVDPETGLPSADGSGIVELIRGQSVSDDLGPVEPQIVYSDEVYQDGLPAPDVMTETMQ